MTTALIQRTVVAAFVAALVAACGPGSGRKNAAPVEPSAKAEGPAAAILAPVPPMGFNTWNKFGCDVDETLIRQTADAMVETGMLDAGYRYLVIDDCWRPKGCQPSGLLFTRKRVKSRP